MSPATTMSRSAGVTALMVRNLERALVAAIERANASPTRANMLRVEAIRREIRETAAGR